MNDFDSYMAMREDAIRAFSEQFQKIFDEAFEDIKQDFILMFDHHYGQTEKNGELIIYTNRPGALIGVAGKNIDKLKELLKEEFKHDYDVKIHEVGHYYFHKKMLGKEESDKIAKKILADMAGMPIEASLDDITKKLIFKTNNNIIAVYPKGKERDFDS